MQRESDRTTQDTDEHRHDDDRRDGHDMPWAIEHSIRPGVPCPETVLVAVMTDGSYLLMAHPQGKPAAFVVGEDADPLRRELAAAFGSPDLTPIGNQDEAS